MSKIVLFALITFIGLMTPSTSATERVGFESGDTFTAYNLQGSLTLYCQTRTRTTNCYGYTLSPTMWDALIFPASKSADEVELKNISSRNQRSKTSKIRNGENRSQKAFNLWVRTLLQRPLLALGSNTISYEFSKSGSTTDQGEFQVYVNDGGNKICPHLRMSGTDNDCDNPTLACDSYFRAVSCQ